MHNIETNIEFEKITKPLNENMGNIAKRKNKYTVEIDIKKKNLEIKKNKRIQYEINEESRKKQNQILLERIVLQ